MLGFRLVLSAPQKRALVNALDVARRQGNLRVITRLLALLSLAENRLSVTEIAQLLRVSLESIRQWVKLYLWKGLRGLTQLKRSPGRPPKLSKTQRRELARLIEAGPEAAGFPGACWRTPMIQEWVLQHFGVLYNVHYLSELLHNIGFSYQKARFAVGGSDPDNATRRQQWVEQTWPAIWAQAKAQNAYLLFGEEVSFPQWGSLTYPWAKKGQQPTVKTSGKRQGYKVFGLIDYFTGRFFYQAQTDRLNSDTYRAFLTEVLAQTQRPIILIQDGARYHTSQALQQFFAAHAERLTVYQLPSYSPDYNPIEQLWKKIKEKDIHLHYFPTFDDLKVKVEKALSRFAQLPQEILSLFGFYTEMQSA